MNKPRTREQLKSAHFEKGILTCGTSRWLLYPSETEYRLFELGEDDCIDLEPEPFEVPMLVGDDLEYCNRRFHRDPLQLCDPGTVPDSLSWYLKSEKYKEAVWKESDFDTEERADEDFFAGNRARRRRQLQRSSIPEAYHERVREWSGRKSPEEIAEELRNLGVETSHSSVERLLRNFKRAGLAAANRAKVEHALAADEDSCEDAIGQVNHLLEQATQAVADEELERAELLRKLALVQHKMVQHFQRRIESGERKLLDVELQQQAQARQAQRAREAASASPSGDVGTLHVEVRAEKEPSGEARAARPSDPASSSPSERRADGGTVTLRGARLWLSLALLFGALMGTNRASLSRLAILASRAPAATASGAGAQEGDSSESRGLTAVKRHFTTSGGGLSRPTSGT